MKKISILSLHLGYGGIEKSIIALANLLCKKYEVEIVCTYKLYDKPVFDLNKKVKVCYLMEGYRPNRVEFKRALKKSASSSLSIYSIFSSGSIAFKILIL